MRRAPVVIAFVMIARASTADAQDADAWFGADKALHFSASAVITAGGYALGAAVFDDTWPRVALGVGIGLGAGVGKELIDLAGYGDPSWRDLAWDVAGAGVGVFIAWGVDVLLRPTRRREAPPGVCPMPRAAFGLRLSPTLSARGASLTLSW